MRQPAPLARSVVSILWLVAFCSIISVGFWTAHRGVIVAYAAVDRIERDLLGRLRIHLLEPDAVLPVSRAYAGLFKQMEK